jgi:hypothetical protein
LKISYVDSPNIGPALIKEKEKRIELTKLNQFDVDANSIFSFKDTNSLVTDLPNINPKLKTSLTYEIDVDAPETSPPKDFTNKVIVQMLIDKRRKEPNSGTVDSNLVFQLTQEYKEKKSRFEFDENYTFFVWNQNGKTDK